MLLFSLIGASTLHPKMLIVLEKTENKPIAQAVIDLGNEEQNTTKIDRQSKKSAFEQFLDAAQKNTQFGYASLKTPYRSMDLVSGQTKAGRTSDGYSYSARMRFIYPHRMEVPSEYAYQLHRELLNSDLLVAAAYAQMYNAGKSDAIIPTKDHGLWKCTDNYSCWKLNESETKQLVTPKNTKETK